MMKISFFLAILLSGVVLAQENQKPNFSKEINEQVWEPFKLSYAAKDADRYNALHTEDILRITKKGIQQGTAFKKEITQLFALKSMPEQEIEFKFEHRIHSENIAYEVGFFKITITLSENDKRFFYGRFSVLLKKIAGKWKIAQDWDTDIVNGVPITNHDYMKL